MRGLRAPLSTLRALCSSDQKLKVPQAKMSQEGMFIAVPGSHQKQGQQRRGACDQGACRSLEFSLPKPKIYPTAAKSRI